MREWVIYAGIMAVVLFVLFRDNAIGALAGLLVSGPLYLAVGAVLAKLGYQRKTLKELRAESTSAAPSASDDASGVGDAHAPRPRPAPTRRTSTGHNRPGSKKRR